MPHPRPTALPLTRRQSLALASAALLALHGPRTARAQSARGLAVQARQDLAPHLYEVVYSTAQKAVFVVSAGGFTPEAPQSKVFRLDPATLAVQAEIGLPLKGFGLALDDAAGRLYVGHALDASVTAIDIASNRVVTTLRLAEMVQKPDGKQEAPYGLRRLAVDPARGRLYLPGLSLKDGVLYTVDTKAMKLEKTVPGIGPGASGIALDASGQRVFVSTLAGQLVTVDADQLAVSRQFAAGGAEQPLKLAWDPAGNRLLAIDQGLEGIRRLQEKNIPGFTSSNPGNRVVALEPETGRLLAEAPVAAGPVTLLPDAAKGQLYVASRGGGALTVLALDSLAKRGELSLPAHPNSLAIDAASSALFVTVKAEPKAGALDPEAVARIAL